MPSKTRVRMAMGVLAVASLLAGCGTANGTSNTPSQNTSNTTNSTTVASTNTVGNQTAPTFPSYTGPVVVTYTGGAVTKPELEQQYNLLIVLFGATKQEGKLQFARDYGSFKYLLGQAMSAVKTPVNTTLAQQYATQSLTQLVGAQGLYSTQAALQAKFKTLGLTEQDLILYYDKLLYIKQFLDSKTTGVHATDAAAQAYYKSHLTSYMTVTVNHILVSTLAKAQSIEAQLKAGANFAKLADKYSTDPGVKQNHGQYANAPVSEFVTQFAQACETLKIGQISDPVHTQYGYHVMRVDKRTVQTFAQAKSAILQTLSQPLVQKQQQAMEQAARKAANVKVVVSASAL